MNYLLKYILFERNKNDNILYHGSLKKYDILKPFKSSLINDEPVVFATNKKWIALCFIIKFKDSDIEVGFINDTPYIMELKKNAFDIFKTKGFIHKVNKKGFKSNKNLGLKGTEFINKSRVKVIDSEEIDDVYMALKNTEVFLIPYDISLIIKEKN